MSACLRYGPKWMVLEHVFKHTISNDGVQTESQTYTSTCCIQSSKYAPAQSAAGI